MVSCCGGRMETKLNLNLSVQYDRSTLLSAVISGLTFEYLLDEVKTVLNNSTSVEKVDILDILRDISDRANEVGFYNLAEWLDNKSEAQRDLLTLVQSVDARLGRTGTFVQELTLKLTEFVISIGRLNVSENEVDYTGINLDGAWIENVLEQMRLVSENEFIVSLASKQLKTVPLETKTYANSFIETKVNKLNAVCEKIEKKLDKDFDKLQDLVTEVNDKFYNISNEQITDGEKFDKARNTVKLINPHRQTIDKVEDILTEALELSRQLTIHEKKLRAADDEKISDTENGIKDNPSMAEELGREMVTSRLVSSQYLSAIGDGKDRVSALRDRLEKYRQMVESLEQSFKTAIPQESDMKKYSSIKHRLNDLQNRLEIAGSQLVTKDKSIKEALSAAKSGLDVLVEIFTDGKDLYLRNNLMSAVFSSVNCLYNLSENEDKDLEKSQKKFMSEKLEDYSVRNASLLKDLVTFRKIGDEVIRDVAIVLGKPLKLDTLYEMLEIQELAINQANQMYTMLDRNHQKQVDLLVSILNV